MKFLNFLLIAIFLAIPTFAQQVNQPVKLTGSSTEKTILDEINEVRKNPQAYAAYLEEYKQHFKGNIVLLPDGTQMQTVEGTKAVDEAIAFLKNAPQVEPLQPSEGLAKPANQQLKDLIDDPTLGHSGRDGSDLAKRLAKFGFTGSMYAENMVQYIQNPREIVITMIVDDGIKSRGNRRNILNSKFKQAGLAYGKDNKGEAIFIGIFTDSFQLKSATAVRIF